MEILTKKKRCAKTYTARFAPQGRLGRDIRPEIAPISLRTQGSGVGIAQQSGGIPMTVQSVLFKSIMLVGLAGLVASCETSVPPTGPDRKTRSESSSITWTDGKPAYAISCEDSGGCQERVLALCRGGNYTTLKSENMPTIGAARAPLGKPSVVVRCGS
jgi:hypothetical protein